MRDYNEVTNAVLRRRDEQIAKDRRRAVIIKRCASAAAACCAAAVIGTGIVKDESNIFTQPEITNVSPAETTTVFSPDNESITTTYNTNSATKITTALSEAAADNTRKRAETKVTSTVQADAICTVTLMNMRADTASKNNAVTSSAHNASRDHDRDAGHRAFARRAYRYAENTRIFIRSDRINVSCYLKHEHRVSCR